MTWWDAETTGFQVEELRRSKGLHIAVLRHKARFIWQTANSGDWESAERKVGYLRTDIQRYAARLTIAEKWRSHQFKACNWLLKNVKNLKICRNRSCILPYFVRDENNQQYCSKYCASEGQRMQWKARKGPPKYKMTPEGSATISRTVKERLQRDRTAKALLSAKDSSPGKN
jgi:hypothetical protein